MRLSIPGYQDGYGDSTPSVRLEADRIVVTGISETTPQKKRKKQRIPIDPLFREGNITRSPAWHSLQGRSRT